MTGLLTWCIVGALLILTAWHRGVRQQVGLFVAGAILCVCSPIALGVFGSLSYGSVGIAAAGYVGQKGDARLSLWIAVSGLVLYASTLGFFSLDLYSFGFEPRGILLWAACSLLLAWFFCPG